VSEAIHLRLDDITPDGLLIRCTKFRKSRLVPLHETARTGLEQYLQKRRSYACFDDHVFVSLRRKPLSVQIVDKAFHTVVKQMGLSPGRRRARPTPIPFGTPSLSEHSKPVPMAVMPSPNTCCFINLSWP